MNDQAPGIRYSLYSAESILYGSKFIQVQYVLSPALFFLMNGFQYKANLDL